MAAVLSPVAAADADDLDVVGRVLVQLDLVDRGVEAVVVGAQGLEDLPDDLVPLVVLQGFFGGHVGGDADGQDDVAVRLAFGPAHDPADGLDDVDDASCAG